MIFALSFGCFVVFAGGLEFVGNDWFWLGWFIVICILRVCVFGVTCWYLGLGFDVVACWFAVGSWFC